MERNRRAPILDNELAANALLILFRSTLAYGLHRRMLIVNRHEILNKEVYRGEVAMLEKSIVS